MGVCPGESILALQADTSDDVSSWGGSYTDDAGTMFSISSSTLLTTAENFNIMQPSPQYQQLDASYEPFSSSSRQPYETEEYKNTICSHFNGSTCELAAVMQAEKEYPTNKLVVNDTFWHPIGRYISEDVGSDPWTMFSFRNLERGIENDVGVELDVESDFEIIYSIRQDLSESILKDGPSK
ncbi:uncharacterized protein DFL_001492 [Arthrobotrys flagrans]|uniref:Uncharacterized protein n=1 Tax=Arthrobotrys flagrans TaxID=97331 RepID=A0A437A8K2_ARTFL|nr:hypothetical protein DFL_001492 [Arthrobotrys flagrans]